MSWGKAFQGIRDPGPHGDQGKLSMPPYKGPPKGDVKLTIQIPAEKCDRCESGGDPGFHAILNEIARMHARKNADYGTGVDPYANVNASKEFGVEPWRAAVIRANEKMTRIKAFCANGKLENESLEDSLLDLAAYAVIALRLKRMQAEAGGQ